MRQGCGEGGMPYRTRFKRLAAGLGRNAEEYKMKFVWGLYNPEMRRSVGKSSGYVNIDKWYC